MEKMPRDNASSAYRSMPRVSTEGEPGNREASIKSIAWYLRRLFQAEEIHSKELVRKYKVSQPQLSCLLALRDEGPLPLSQLARLILVKPSTVTGIIDRLEVKGLVTRTRQATDRRVVAIALTESGMAVAAEAPPPVPASILDGLRRLPESDVKRIVESLDRLAAMLEEPDPPE